MCNIVVYFNFFAGFTFAIMVESTFEKRCLNIAAPTALSFTSASMFSVLILINVPGNVLIILALVFDPNKNLRTPFSWLVANLATADLIVGIISQPITVSSLIKEGLRKHGIPGEWITSHMSTYISCIASVLSLISLAVERYLAVRKPNTYRTKVTNKRIVLTIVMIWVISLCLPTIYLYVGFTTYGFIFANTSIIFAAVIISATYTLMKRQLNKIRLRNSRNPNAFSMSSTSIAINSAHSVNTTSQIAQSNSAGAKVFNAEQFANMNASVIASNALLTRRQLIEAKVTKMFVIVLIAFLCCYGPSTIMMYLVNFCVECSCRTLHWFRDIHVLTLYMNSSVNFFCYALRSSTFQNAFAKLLRIDQSRKRESSATLTTSQNVPAQEEADPAPSIPN